MRAKRESETGFTLLELALALALASSFITAFFMIVGSMMRSINMVAAGGRASGEGAEVLDLITKDLDRATTLEASSSMGIQFQIKSGTGTRRIAYRLVALDAASRDIAIERAETSLPTLITAAASTTIGPRRMIANFNPYLSSFYGHDGVLYIPTKVPVYSPVATFLSYNEPLDGVTTPQITIYLMLQPNMDSPPTYARAISAPRVLNSWVQ